MYGKAEEVFNAIYIYANKSKFGYSISLARSARLEYMNFELPIDRIDCAVC